MKKLPLTIFEIVAYSILILMGLWALIYVALGIACEFIRYDTSVAEANAKLNLGFLWEGLIILGATAIAAVVVLLIHAKKTDRDFEKAQRRAARLNKKAPTQEVVEAEVAPVEEANPEEKKEEE